MKIGKYITQLSLRQPKCFLLGYKIAETILLIGMIWLALLCYKFIEGILYWQQ